MPKATANLQDTHRLDLKSVPEGYVIARRLTYGEKQRRMQIAAGQSMDTGSRNNGRPDKVDVVIHNFDIQYFDFSHCIVEHNLTKDEEDRFPINFKNISDFEMLDDAVGREIEDFLDSINNEDTEEERATFPASNEQSNSNEPTDIGSGSDAAEHTATGEGVAPQS